LYVRFQHLVHLSELSLQNLWGLVLWRAGLANPGRIFFFPYVDAAGDRLESKGKELQHHTMLDKTKLKP